MDTEMPFRQQRDAADERQAHRAKPWAAAGGAPPPYGNTGGKSPSRPGKGESPHPDQEKGQIAPDAAFTDYLNVTYGIAGQQDPFGYFLDAFPSVAGDLFGGFEDRGRGFFGYDRSFGSEFGGAIFAYGGQRETALLSIPGEGCALVRDWDSLGVWLRDWLDARITRWDGAADDFEGLHPVEEIADAYLAGAFTIGGRRPSHRLEGDWLQPQGNGRTFYVGRRKNGKLYRGYEKGKQLGDPASLWVRHEVELHNRDRIVPWDVLWHPGKYVAGAYPYLAWVREDSLRIRSLRKAASISLEHLASHCRRTYGRLINLLTERGLAPEEIVRALSRVGVPERLETAHRVGAV
jgi:phage replication initiation protein